MNRPAFDPNLPADLGVKRNDAFSQPSPCRAPKGPLDVVIVNDH